MNIPIQAVTWLTLDLSHSEIQKSVTVTEGDTAQKQRRT